MMNSNLALLIIMVLATVSLSQVSVRELKRLESSRLEMILEDEMRYITQTLRMSAISGNTCIKLLVHSEIPREQVAKEIRRMDRKFNVAIIDKHYIIVSWNNDSDNNICVDKRKGGGYQ
jgi:hypothetical protein